MRAKRESIERKVRVQVFEIAGRKSLGSVSLTLYPEKAGETREEVYAVIQTALRAHYGLSEIGEEAVRRKGPRAGKPTPPPPTTKKTDGGAHASARASAH